MEQVGSELRELLEVIKWIDDHTSGLMFPTDERSLMALGCYDVAIEHQASVALLANSELLGSAFALLRVQAESLVRGMWFQYCASDKDLARFKKGKMDQTFMTLINEVEAHIGTPSGILTNFKKTAWNALNGFTHTGYHQVSRRHANGKIEGTYSDQEISNALGLSGALGLITAGQLIGFSGDNELVHSLFRRMKTYAKT